MVWVTNILLNTFCNINKRLISKIMHLSIVNLSFAWSKETMLTMSRRINVRNERFCTENLFVWYQLFLKSFISSLHIYLSSSMCVISQNECVCQMLHSHFFCFTCQCILLNLVIKHVFRVNCHLSLSIVKGNCQRTNKITDCICQQNAILSITSLFLSSDNNTRFTCLMVVTYLFPC